MRNDFVPSLVTVITPVYNRRQLIIESLNSIVIQSYRPIEMVVIDDGSSDGSGDAVTTWFHSLDEKQREGLKLNLIRTANGGAQRARNLALSVAQGAYIQLLDSDDILHPRKIEEQKNHLERNPDLGFVYSEMVTFSKDFESKLFSNNITEMDFQNIHIASLNWIQGLFRRETCILLGPFNDQIACRQDMEYLSRLYVSGLQTGFLEGCYAAGRRHEGTRISTSAGCQNGFDALKTISAIFENANKLDNATQQLLADQFFRAGLSALIAGNTHLAYEAMASGLSFRSSTTRRAKLYVLRFLARPYLGRWMQGTIVNTMNKLYCFVAGGVRRQ